MTSTILDLAERCIGKRKLTERKSTHPYLTERAEKAIDDRNNAFGTQLETQAVIDCSAVLKEEREAYISRTRNDIRNLKPASKQWHSKSRELLGDEANTCNIPALKLDNGDWELNAKGKADLLATTMSGKYALGPQEVN